MTHGMSVIDLKAQALLVTVLFDTMVSGGADPWGIALARDGATAWVTLAGVHEVARLDLARLHALLEGKAPKEVMDKLAARSLWRVLVKEPARRVEIANDLSAMTEAGIMTRIAVKARGPRGVALSPDGGVLALADYFGGGIVFLNTATRDEVGRVVPGPQPQATAERRGEAGFFDAALCFQNWLSCGSCHPEGRADGLNWDLLNDGIGNAKNAKSLVMAGQTPPVMSTGVRASMEVATRTGLMFIQFRMADEAAMDDIRAYIRALRPEASPYLEGGAKATLDCAICHADGRKKNLPQVHRSLEGTLSAKAERGRKVFLDAKVGCAVCHPGPLFTDLKMYDVGTGKEIDQRNDFDTPMLHELWRTAPYLHDGSVVTLMDVLTTGNKGDKHGRTSHLSDEDRQALVEFLRSL